MEFLDRPLETIIDMALMETIEYTEYNSNEPQSDLLRLHENNLLEKHGIKLLSYSIEDISDDVYYFQAIKRYTNKCCLEMDVRTTVRALLKLKLMGFIEFTDDHILKIKNCSNRIMITSMTVKTTRYYADGTYQVE